MLIRRALLLVLLFIGSAACSGPASKAGGNAMSLALLEGNPEWVSVSNKNTIPLPANALLAPGDEIRSTADKDSVIQFADGSQIRLSPNTRISIQPVRSPDSRLMIRLWNGQVQVTARGQGFLIESYREVAVRFSMVQYSLELEPQSNSSEFSLWLTGDTAKAQIDSGVVAVQAAAERGLLQAGWQAELTPDQALRIIPAVTATPLATATLVVPGTPDFLPSWTPTATPLATPTPTPTLTPTPTPTFIAPIIVASATATPAPSPTDKPDSPPKPHPTNPRPTNPPPTDPPPPDTPRPPTHTPPPPP